MKHDFEGFEQAAFWLHVIVAFVLLMVVIGDKERTTGDWFGVGWETLAVELTPDSLLPESSPGPSAQPGMQVPATSMTGGNASLSATGTCRREWP